MKLLVTAAAVLAFSVPAFAADLASKAPPPVVEAKPLIVWPTPNFDILAGGFDYAFGAKFQSDYIFRGISQTARRPGGTAYGEVRYGWFYAGVQPWSVKLPQDPLAEVDIYGGIRPVWGSLTLDFGALYYAYPSNKTQYFLGGTQPVLTYYTPFSIPSTPRDPSFLELYAKGTWAVNDWFTIGANTNYTSNWVGTGAKALYSEINAKFTIPDSGFSVSGAYGHYFLGRGSTYLGNNFFDLRLIGPKYASYDTYNVGASYNWNAITFDVRYYGTNLDKARCYINTSDPAGNFGAANGGIGTSNWCGNRIMGSVSVDFTSASFK